MLRLINVYVKVGCVILAASRCGRVRPVDDVVVCLFYFHVLRLVLPFHVEGALASVGIFTGLDVDLDIY